MDQELVILRVISGQKVILKWFAFKTDGSGTFLTLLEAVVLASRHHESKGRFSQPLTIDDKSKLKVYVGESPATPNEHLVEAQWGLTVNELVRTVGKYVTFIIQPPDDTPVVQNAFNVLMSNRSKQHELYYPDVYNETPTDEDKSIRSDWRIKNDIIKLMKSENAGLNSPKAAGNQGKQFVNTVGNAIHYVLPHLKQFKERCCQLPDIFQHEFVQNDGITQDIVQPEKHKHKARPLENEILDSYVNQIYTIISHPCFSHRNMRKLYGGARDLAECMAKYSKTLSSRNSQMKNIHSLPHPVREPGDELSTSLKFIAGKLRCDMKLVQRYESLEMVLRDKQEYQPVSLTDFTPSHRRLRFQYIHSIQLPFGVEVYASHPGGPRPAVYFIWKCGKAPDLTKSNIVVSDIQKELPVYHTRQMRKDFKSRFDLVSKASNSVLNEMYKYLTGHETAEATMGTSKEVRQRLLLMLDSQDPNLEYDRRTMLQGKLTQYDQFYDEVNKYIEEYELKAVDDRRHGRIMHSAVAMSVRDLRDRVKLRCPEDITVPSIEMLRLQFMPKSIWAQNAIQYTGRFNLKFRIQSRQFSMLHIDSHYCAALQNYLKCLTIKLRAYTSLISADDKCHIPVGEPGVPIATIYRCRRSIAHTEITNTASDHDTSAKCKLTPSVMIDIAIPENIDDSFYDGQVTVTLKDSIFQPSSPMRHTTEIQKCLSEESLMKPVRVLFTDGGPDHRVNYPSVKLALIAMYQEDDLDCLLAVRTAPHQSYRNWVERIMSTLNLALQTIAIARENMSEAAERHMKAANTMVDIRKLAEQQPAVGREIQDSIASCTNQLNGLFKNLELKGKAFKVSSPATLLEIDKMYDSLAQVDPSIQRSDSTAKQLKSRAALQEFMEHCCVSRKYFFFIKKCGSLDCKICRPPRLSPDVFSLLKRFPDPEPDPGKPEHYKKFDDLYGTETSEKYCPSINQPKAGALDKDSLSFTASQETARAVVSCMDCKKPRCIYAAKKLTDDQNKDLSALLEEADYSCGSPLIPPDHNLYGTCGVLENITCANPVVAHYFGSRTKFPLVCYSCGNNEPLQVSVEMRELYQTVHPVCQECKASGIRERTRAKAKKRKAKD